MPPSRVALAGLARGRSRVSRDPVACQRREQPAKITTTTVLTDRTATLRGVVRTQKGTPTDGAVLVFAEDQSLWHGRFTTTKMTYATGGGAFRLEGLRAGRYLVVAIDRDNASLRDTTPEYFELLARLATFVSIADGEAPPLDLTLVLVAD